MFGKVEEQNGINEPVTLAGPAEGVVSKVAYCCDIDYDMVLTNGGLGTGYVGISTCCPITYNPYCCVGSHIDEDTGEEVNDYAGVLVVDCIVSKVADGDKSKMVYDNMFSNAVAYNVALWDNCDLSTTCNYNYVGTSNTYPLTFSPDTGTLCSRCVCAGCQVVTGLFCGNNLCFCSTGGNIYNAKLICSLANLNIKADYCVDINSYSTHIGGCSIHFNINPIHDLTNSNYLPFMKVTDSLDSSLNSGIASVVVYCSTCSVHAGYTFPASPVFGTIPSLVNNADYYYELCDACFNKALFKYCNSTGTSCFIKAQTNVSIFAGTAAQWNALSASVRSTYDLVGLTDV